MTREKRDAVLGWIEDHGAEMLDMLARLVSIDSGSYNKAGVDRVGEEITNFLVRSGVRCTFVRDQTYGDILRAEVNAANGAVRPALLMGHRDTVFPDGEAERRPFRIEGGRAYGPGVADMKSGVVMNAFVLAAFAQSRVAPVPLLALFTGDEEIGSPFSRPHIESAAREASIALNSEPGRANGNVVADRRGCVFIRLEVFGRSAHSGVNFSDGISAIEEIARKIQDLYCLIDADRSITVNVGKLAAGQTVNTIAPHAVAELDMRYASPQDRGPLLDAIGDIFARSHVAGTRCEHEIFGEFPPMHQTEESRRLLECYRASARSVGLSLLGEFTNGAADSGFAAAMGTPTLCGLGPVGGRAHTQDEYVEIGSIIPRAKALALTILRHFGHEEPARPDDSGSQKHPHLSGPARPGIAEPTTCAPALPEKERTSR